MVAKAVPGCWEVVAPETLCRVRAIAAAEALGEVCDVEVPLRPPGRPAAAAAGGGGLRRGGTGHGRRQPVALAPHRHGARAPAGSARPGRPARRCASTAGDGHVAALVVHGLGGLEAHVLAAGTKAIPVEVLRDNRGWSEEEWDGATAGLAARGPAARRRARHRRRPHPARPRSRS